MASYQKPFFAFDCTLCRSQVKIGPSTRHSLNSQRSIMPPTTISFDGASESRTAETYQRYCTSGSSTMFQSLRSMAWMPAWSGGGSGPSCNGLVAPLSLIVNFNWYVVGFERNQFRTG